MREIRAPLLGVGLLCLVLAGALILANQPYVPRNDSADYAYLAHRMVDGHGMTRAPGEQPTAERAPLYPLFLAGVFALGGGTRTAQLATAATAAVAAMLLCLVVFLLWGRRPAVAAGILGAVFPPWLAGATGLFTEPLFLALELAAIAAVLVLRRRPTGYAVPILLGVICGLAALTRSNGLLVLVVTAPAVWFAVRGGGRPGVPRRSRSWRRA